MDELTGLQNIALTGDVLHMNSDQVLPILLFYDQDCFKEFIFHCMYLNAILYHFGIVFIMMGAVNIFIGPVHICISGLGGAFLYDEL